MTVYVVQDPQHWDSEAGSMKSRFNIHPAMQHGSLRIVLPPRVDVFNLEYSRDELIKQLTGYDHTEDHLLLLGNPSLIGMAVAIAAAAGTGDVSILQWSGKEDKYLPITVSLPMEL